MGEVFRARDRRLERDVALKVRPAGNATDATARARLVREARMAARLNHPHVCTVHDVGEADGQVFIAMELVEGRPLDAVLAAPLPVADALRYGKQIASALAHAHARGVVHRDLKSANVVITPEGQAKVLDFGLAKPLASEAGTSASTITGHTLTEVGSLTGTLAYMAPEQLCGQPADARSDIWALGVVLYELASGSRGSTHREGARIQITADLVEVQGQSVLWADTFERESSGIMGVQRDVARNVARALALALLPAEQAALASTRRIDAEAYDLYLKGSQFWIRLTKPDLDAAEQYFQAALAKQPDYAAAYAGLALVWVGRQQMGLAAPSEAATKAKAAATRAVELDGGLAEAHFVRALIRTFTDWDFAAADTDWKRAIDLNPNLAETRTFYSHYLAIMQRPAESAAHVEQALALDPFNPLIQAMQGMQRLLTGRYDEALAALQRGPEGFRVSGMWYAHAMLGHDTEAAAALKAFLQSMGDDAVAEAFERGWEEGGYRSGAKRAAAALAASKTASFVLTDLAIIHVEAGETAPALDCLERGFDERDPNMPYLGRWPFFKCLYGEPRFQALYRRLGLPAQA